VQIQVTHFSHFKGNKNKVRKEINPTVPYGYCIFYSILDVKQILSRYLFADRVVVSRKVLQIPINTLYNDYHSRIRFLVEVMSRRTLLCWNNKLRATTHETTAHSLTHSHSLSLTLTHSHSHSLSLTLTLTLTLTHSLTHSLTLTLNHTHNHTHSLHSLY
jgi:hypothetical protein